MKPHPDVIPSQPFGVQPTWETELREALEHAEQAAELMPEDLAAINSNLVLYCVDVIKQALP